MTRITSFDLAPFYRNSIGLDRLFDRIQNQFEHASTTNYPPHDIVRINDDHYEIRIAVAGFQQGEIDVRNENSQLIIAGEQPKERQVGEYLHHGISNRGFVRNFTLADYVEVGEAIMKDGILSIKLERKIPEHMKPKSIEITYIN